MPKTTSLFLTSAFVAATAACASAPPPEPVSPRDAAAADAAASTTTTIAAAAARADSLRASHTQADVDFVLGMIPHHEQALVMARMASTHGASASLQVLAGRIINAQNDEIALMRRWLSDRGIAVPDAGHAMHHGAHSMHMPGMLTPAQFERLDAARGADFDRLFLTYMIQHHEGAMTMVDRLFATHGAAQGDDIFKIASDIGVDQRTEIERMRLMLRDLVLETPGAGPR